MRPTALGRPPTAAELDTGLLLAREYHFDYRGRTNIYRTRPLASRLYMRLKSLLLNSFPCLCWYESRNPPPRFLVDRGRHWYGRWRV